MGGAVRQFHCNGVAISGDTNGAAVTFNPNYATKQLEPGGATAGIGGAAHPSARLGFFTPVGCGCADAWRHAATPLNFAPLRELR